MDPIGGEFAISPSWLTPREPHGSRPPASGRGALFQILRHTLGGRDGQRIALPSYVCQSVLDAVVAAGHVPHLYAVGDDLRPDRTDLSLRLTAAPAAVIFVSYFGLVDPAEDLAWTRAAAPEAILIRDDVHSPFGVGAGADFAFTSLRKALPVVDGAPVTPSFPMPLDTDTASPFALAKLAGALAKHGRSHDEVLDRVFLELLAEGERRLESTAAYSAAMSWMSSSIASTLDIDSIADRRRQNFRALEEAIRPLGLRPLVPLADARVPLFLPVRVRARDALQRGLRDLRIYCPVHWPAPRAEDPAPPSVRRLYESELSLVIDQRYGEDEMHRLATALRDLGAAPDGTQA